MPGIKCFFTCMKTHHEMTETRYEAFKAHHEAFLFNRAAVFDVFLIAHAVDHVSNQLVALRLDPAQQFKSNPRYWKNLFR